MRRRYSSGERFLWHSRFDSLRTWNEFRNTNDSISWEQRLLLPKHVVAKSTFNNFDRTYCCTFCKCAECETAVMCYRYDRCLPLAGVRRFSTTRYSYFLALSTCESRFLTESLRVRRRSKHCKILGFHNYCPSKLSFRKQSRGGCLEVQLVTSPLRIIWARCCRI